MKPMVLYDTTLRDGTQGENINFSAEEKLRIAHLLDDFGIHYIEGGWPGSNPKDMRFFEIAKDAKMTETAIRVFLRTPHDRMPDFLLTGDQTDDLVAYFMELKATAR